MNSVLRMDDELAPALDNNFVDNVTVIPKLTGVLGYSFGAYKVLAQYPIESIRDAAHPLHPPSGTSATGRDLYVTAIRPGPTSQGFYAQANSTLPHKGIFVFTHTTSPGVAVGNTVDVTGSFTNYFGLDELDVPNVAQGIVITKTGTALPFSPLAVTPGTIATGRANAEPYQSMLLKVQSVAVVTQNPDAPSDFDEFVVTGGPQDRRRALPGARQHLRRRHDVHEPYGDSHLQFQQLEARAAESGGRRHALTLVRGAVPTLGSGPRASGTAGAGLFAARRGRALRRGRSDAA